MKIKIKRTIPYMNSGEYDMIKKSYSLIKDNEFKKAKKILKDIPLEMIVERFIQDYKSTPNDKTLNIFRKLLIILKHLYSNDMTMISDKLYDLMLNRYKLYRDEPVVESLNLGRRVVNVDHKYPELKGTLDKANILYIKDKVAELDSPLEKYINSFFKANDYHPITVAVSLKADGVSVVVEQNDSKKVDLALSRGEDDKGADLTHLFNHIKFNKKDTAGIKFEIVITEEDFKKYCEDRGKDYVNKRSAVVSIVTRTKDTKYSKYLSLFPIASSNLNQYDIDKLNKYYATNITNNATIIKANNTNDFMEQFETIARKYSDERDSLPIAIDGLVIDCLDEQVRKSLGRKNNINQYQVAYKFPPLSRITHVTGITTETGRTGLVTPMIHYDEIDFNGAKHNKSSLSSYDRFIKMDLRMGDELIVTYNNDVMPYPTKPMNEFNLNNMDKKLKFPTNCSSCGCELQKNGSNYFCLNNNCPSRLIASMEHFYKKLGIADISEKTIEIFVNNGIIKDMYNLLELDYDKILELNNFGKLKVANIKHNIDECIGREIDEAKLVSALSVSGERISRKILSRVPICKILEDRNNLMMEDIESIGDITKNTFITNIENTKDLINHYKNILKINLVKENKNKIIVCFSGFRDKKLTELLSLIDIEVSDNLKKSVSYLVVPSVNETSSKVTKAKSYGIPILTKDEFAKLIKIEI